MPSKLEDGYLLFANSLAEKLGMYRIPGEETQILWIIIRQTYGWKKKVDKISLSQFVKKTGIGHRGVARALNNLVKKNIIIKKLGSGKYDTSNTTSYSINTSCEKWKVVSKKTPSVKKDTGVVSKKRQKAVSNLTHTKDNKDTIQKKEQFECLWEKYPTSHKQGKDVAVKRYLTTVKTDTDRKNIETALTKYKKSDRVSKGYVLRASKWFDEWQDWVDHIDQPKERKGHKL